MHSTLGSINLLPEKEKRAIYARFVPGELLQKFSITNLAELLEIKGAKGSTDTELKLFHRHSFPDPILYCHLTDTVSGQIHVLLYILNDPDSPRFDVDRMPDGSPTQFGTAQRNLQAERAALEAGLAPGQIRHGLRMLPTAVQVFEQFIASLGNELYFVEPLYYHNAVIFERYGFNYQVGRKFMEQIDAGFDPDGSLRAQLDGATPFRSADAAQSIRLRSWAIHDGILGEPFTNVTMYKRVEKDAGIKTTECKW
jgi:acetoin utilization protein AcuC